MLGSSGRSGKLNHADSQCPIRFGGRNRSQRIFRPGCLTYRPRFSARTCGYTLSQKFARSVVIANGRRAGDNRCNTTGTRPLATVGLVVQPKHSCSLTANTGGATSSSLCSSGAGQSMRMCDPDGTWRCSGQPSSVTLLARAADGVVQQSDRDDLDGCPGKLFDFRVCQSSGAASAPCR